jgi:hypothetical protein
MISYSIRPEDIQTEEEALKYVSEYGPYWSDSYFDNPLLWQAFYRLTSPDKNWVIYNDQVWDANNLDDQIHMRKLYEVELRQQNQYLDERERGW